MSEDKDSVFNRYRAACATPSDINEHLVTLYDYASLCRHVTEFGTREVVSTWALLAAKPERLVCYDLYTSANIEAVKRLAPPVKFAFIQANDLEVDIEPTDMLFIDTDHTYDHLTKELYFHHHKVGKYIVLHDTVAYPDLVWAAKDFMADHPEWVILKEFTNNNGLMILTKRKV